MLEYPIWHKLRKVANSYSRRQAQRPLAVATALRNFVAKNPRMREVFRHNRIIENPMLTHRAFSHTMAKENSEVIVFDSWIIGHCDFQNLLKIRLSAITEYIFGCDDV